jgi:hypothetical protein
VNRNFQIHLTVELNQFKQEIFGQMTCPGRGLIERARRFWFEQFKVEPDLS